MRTFRVFISSPGDVHVERRRSENVVGRLNGEFFGLARLETIRWETEFYRADSTFQTQIPPAADCDVVIGILKWRLGTELPPDFGERLPDGRSYPSGTAYELLTAVHKRQSGADLPDVFVFRYAGGSPRLEIEDPTREQVEREWAALRAFFQSWFVTSQGQFIAALNQYASEDQFEDQLESLLRKWLAEKVADGKVVPWPAAKGSPFRGLNVFGAKHASIFFGRHGDIRKAGDLWRDAAARGTPFLLIVGASGAGKSSMARAGLIPRVTTPGVISGVDVWRIAAMRPSDSPDGPFAALATALLQTEAGLPPGEEGRGPALPEIAEGDSKTPAELAALLSHADDGAARPILNALVRIGDRTRERERYGREVRCGLVLLIDQLDELFAPSLPAERRNRFAELMAALVASGRVWLLATLRADLYQPMLAVEALKRLKDEGASYDLVPPGPAELAEIVREPAKAAGLVFETDRASGERLDERLLREADRPDMLPLVQLALSRLWEARITIGAETVLPYAAFDRIGGVKGIIEEAGEAAVATLEDTARVHLGPLLRRLAELSHGSVGGAATLTARAVPLVDAAPDANARRLVDHLIDARLLTLDGQSGATSIRLAHQRVLTDWARAAAIVADGADFYRVREMVEDQRQRWEANRRRGDLLLARGLPLAEARAMVNRYGPELGPGIQSYVAASRRRASRSQTIGWTVAALFAVLAISAGVAAKVAIDRTVQAEAARSEAETEKRDAQRDFAAAKATVDALIFDIAEGLRDNVGVRIDTIRRILDTARNSVDRLSAAAPDDQQLQNSRLVMLKDFTETYLTAGDTPDAIASAEETLALARKLVARSRDAPQSLRDLSASLERLGDVRRRSGDPGEALEAYEECLAVNRERTTLARDDAEVERDLSSSLNDVGDLRLLAGNSTAALAAFSESLAIVRHLRMLHPDDVQVARDLAVTLTWMGKAKLLTRDRTGALAAFEEGFAMARTLSEQAPGDVRVQRDLSASAIYIADVKLQAADVPGALAGYEEGLAIRQRLGVQDPGNAEVQFDISVVLNKIGDVQLAGGDRQAALTTYDRALDIRRSLEAHDTGNAERKRALLTSLGKVAGLKLDMGDRPGALGVYQEATALRRVLALQEPRSPRTVRELCVSLDKLGDVELRSGDVVGALASIEESLALRRRLADENPHDAEARHAVLIELTSLATVELSARDAEGASTLLREALSLAEARVALDPQSDEARDDVTAVGAALRSLAR